MLLSLLTNNSMVFQTSVNECPRGTADQTAEHVLNHYPALHDLRKATWPQPTPLHQKLHGSLTDLRNTVNFMADSGLEV